MKARHRIASTVAALALTIVGAATFAGGADAKGGDAPQNVVVAADCGGVGSATAGFNKSGSRVTLMFNMVSAPTGRSWQVSASDTGVVLFSDRLDGIGSNWTLLRTYDSAKGRREVTVVADATDGSQHCVATLSFKV